MALKILLADDNITAQKMGSKILTDAGYQVVAVSNGAAAMKKIASEKPELLILDVYMPGYSGLEVCQKVKSAPATAALPVILTVTNMEPFSPEDGNKVKADGVMIKPFEATDLIAIVEKFEAKLHAPAPPPPEPEPEYEKTVKMAAMGFQDASYEEWKAEAPPEEREEAAQQLAVPQEMAAAPALGMEDILGQAPEAAATPSPEATRFEPAPAAQAATPFMDLETVAAAAPEEMAAPPPEVEFTSAPQVGEIEIAPAAELELNGHAAPAVDISIVQDPALVTNAEDMAQFVTKFGDAPGQPSYSIEQPVVPAEPEPSAAIAEAAEAAPAVSFEPPAEQPPAEVAPAEESAAVMEAPPAVAPAAEFAGESSAASLEEEMRRAFDTGGGAAAAPALAPEPAPAADPEPILEEAPFVEVPAAPVVEPPPPPPPEAAAVPDKLVEQFAAELAQVAPAEVVAEEVAPPEPVAETIVPPAPPAAALDEERVSEAVQRVMSRYKDELVAAIVRELKS